MHWCGRLTLAGLLLVSTTGTWAASGYFLYSYGTNSRAMGGTGVALSDGPMAIAANPAAIVGLRGTQAQVGATLLHSNAGYRASDFPPPSTPPPGSFPLAPGMYETDPDVPAEFADIFPIPHAAFTYRLDSESAVGIGVYGNGGLNTEYEPFDNPTCPASTPERGALCFGTAASDIAQLFVTPTYARQLTPNLRIGVSLVAAYQTLEVRGLQAFAPASRAPGKLSDNGHDSAVGYGGKLGLQWRIRPGLRFGATYQSRVYMTEFDDYAGLLAEQGDFDTAPYLQAGFAWDMTERWTLAADYQEIRFSEIPALANEPEAGGRLGDDNGPGFGWEDTRLYKVGARFRASPKWTFRMGYAHGSQPQDRDELFMNLVTLSLFEHHFSLGVSQRLSEANTLDLGVVWVPETSLAGPNARYPAQTIRGSNELITVDFSVRHRF